MLQIALSTVLAMLVTWLKELSWLQGAAPGVAIAKVSDLSLKRRSMWRTRSNTGKVGVVGRARKKVGRDARKAGDTSDVSVRCGRVLMTDNEIFCIMEFTRGTYEGSYVEPVSVAVRLDLDGVGLVRGETILSEARSDVGQVARNRAVSGGDLNDTGARGARGRINGSGRGARGVDNGGGRRSGNQTAYGGREI